MSQGRRDQVKLDACELEVALWTQEQIQAWLRPDQQVYSHDVRDWILVGRYCQHVGPFVSKLYRRFRDTGRCPWCEERLVSFDRD